MTREHWPVTRIRIADLVVPHDRMRKLRPEKVDEIAESVAAQGLLQPIIVRPRGAANFWLVAGHHRLEAVRKCGHDSISAVICDGLDADQALLAEIDENLVRADLSPAERALHVERRKEIYEGLHPETKHGAVGRGGKSSQNENSFVADIAEKTGKGRSTIARDVTRARKIVVLGDIAGTSLDQGDELDALAGLPEAEQRKLAKQAKTGERVTAKHVAQKLRRESRARELAAATEAASKTLGEKVYSVIYADPPWKFEVHAESGMDRCADGHYACMPTEAIKALKVPAAADCVLFLWATVPMLDQNIEVLKAWGFTYKSAVFWKKDRPGTGYWIRNTIEVLLIGTRGNIPAPTPGEQPAQVIEAPRGRHSEKPVVFAEMIEKLYPNVPKLEMFARTARPGWDVHGNEAPVVGKDADDLSIPDCLRRAEGNAP
ncbi:MAG: MT-A70 family methyltransferase [Rhodomicrobium sp.]